MKNWVLLRGLGRQAGHWGSFAQDLAGKTKREPLCLDLPGTGKHRSSPCPLRVEDYTDFLRNRFLEQKADHEPWGLIAISFGGMIALDWSSRYPQDFMHLVLINSSTGDLSRPWERMRPKAAFEICRIAKSKDVRTREQKILELTTAQFAVEDGILDRWCELDRQAPMQLSVFLKQTLAATRFRSPAKLPLKPLVLAGTRDNLVSPLCSKKIAEKYEGVLCLDPLSGHDLPLDHPSWIIERMSEHSLLG